MPRSARVELNDAKISNIFNNLEKLLRRIYPNLQQDKVWTYPATGLRLMSWQDPATRMAFQVYLQPGKKLPRGMTKLFIFGQDGTEGAIQLGDFVGKFHTLQPLAEYGEGGGYAKSPKNFLVFVEDMI